MKRPLCICSTKRDPSSLPYEIVERKGKGHPDTLADALAEHLSCVYSRFTLKNFAAILRHQFDKTAIMCGRSKVAFGSGELIDPIRVLLNGRASARLGEHNIPIRDLLTEETRNFFRSRFPMLNPQRDIRIIFEVRSGPNTTTGGIHGDADDSNAPIHYRFDPRSLNDLPETRRVESNDTSLGCFWAPHTPLERLVLSIEHTLTSRLATSVGDWVGSDIKIMATRNDNQVSLVVAVPILCQHTHTAEEYFSRIRLIEEFIRSLCSDQTPQYRLVDLVVNSGDDLHGRKLYMNFTGSSIESGDEGLVGRGNRMGGLITPCRPYTMEGIAGKNPRYHVGKVYSVAAYEIASRLFNKHGISSNVFLINRMAEPLATPWRAIIETPAQGAPANFVEEVFSDVLDHMDSLTRSIVDGAYPLY
jgi:S-adenosylmethionine synthetase